MNELPTSTSTHPDAASDPVEEAGLESFPASDPPAWGRSAEGGCSTPSTEDPPRSHRQLSPKEDAHKAAGINTGRTAPRARRSKTSIQKGKP